MTGLSFEERVRGLDDFPDPEVAPDQSWRDRDLVSPALSPDEACRLRNPLAANRSPATCRIH